MITFFEVNGHLFAVRRLDEPIMIKYVPMHKTHIDNVSDDLTSGYACLSQCFEAIEDIRELLGKQNIDAAMFKTETGEYTNIYVSFEQGIASFDISKQWFKVLIT